MKVTGRIIVYGIVGFAAVYAAALWYFQTYAYYTETQAVEVQVAGQAYPVLEWQGIDASSSPMKLRACFRLSRADAEAIAGAAEAAPRAEPLVAPDWFDCFDAKRLSEDLTAGTATAVFLGPSPFDGVDEYLAVYADGNAFKWRQLNEKYADQ